MSDGVAVTFGQRVRAAREARGLPLYVVAFHAETTFSWLRRIEAGQEQPSPRLRRALLAALGLEPDPDPQPDPEPTPVAVAVPARVDDPPDMVAMARIVAIGEERFALNRQLSTDRLWREERAALIARRTDLDVEEERLWREVRRARSPVPEMRVA